MFRTLFKPLIRSVVLIFFVSFIGGAVQASSIDKNLEPSEIDRIALQAYIYLYPMVLMDITRSQMTNMPLGENPSRGPMNTFVHIRAFPDAGGDRRRVGAAVYRRGEMNPSPIVGF